MDDIFGKSGRYILDGLVEEKPIEEILKGIPSGKIRKKQDLIKAALENGLNDTNRMLVKDALEILDNLESKIEKLEPRGPEKDSAKEQRSGHSHVDSRNWIRICIGHPGRDWRLP